MHIYETKKKKKSLKNLWNVENYPLTHISRATGPLVWNSGYGVGSGALFIQSCSVMHEAKKAQLPAYKNVPEPTLLGPKCICSRDSSWPGRLTSGLILS